jgi:hypothetical protein
MTWNTLDVPLENGWKCTLIPAKPYHYMMWRGYDDLSARALYPKAGVRWRSHYEREPGDYEKRSQWKEDADRQLADDQRTFARAFRPAWDLRTITGGNALSAIQSFVRDSLNVVHWQQPTDNAGVRRMLCDAVASGRLIPVVNREYQGVSRVAQPSPAPQSWPSLGGGGGYGFKPKVIFYDEFTALQRANGELADVAGSTSFGASLNPFPQLGAPASADDGFDLLGVVESAAGALPGGADDDWDGGDDNAVEEAVSGDLGDNSTLLGDAQPFEYNEDMPDGDSFDIAKTPNLGEPGTWYTNPGSGQMRLFGDDGKPALDLDFDHVHNGLQPHAHNWTNGVRDGGDDVVPFSPWSP